VAAQLVDELLTDTGLAEPVTDGPPVPDLDGAAVIGVRNSAVAVWRWRRYAADTKLAGNQIRLDSWCGILGLRLSDTPA